MKTLNRFITEKLKISKDIKIYNSIDIDKLVNDILEHLLIIQMYDKAIFIKRFKPIIKNWIEDNDVHEIEYWMTTFNYDYIMKKLKITHEFKSTINHKYDINDIIGPVEERRKNQEIVIDSFNSLYINKKYITHNGRIYCIKKS